MDPLEKVMLDGPEKFTYARSILYGDEKEQLRLVLLNNVDVFAWRYSNMVGISLTVAFDKLNIIPTARASSIEA